jgi:hypothetical protein
MLVKYDSLWRAMVKVPAMAATKDANFIAM